MFTYADQTSWQCHGFQTCTSRKKTIGNCCDAFWNLQMLNLNGPAAFVLAILKDELCVLEFRAPGFEGVDVKDASRYNICIYVNRYRSIVIFQTITDKLSFVFALVLNTIHEITAFQVCDIFAFIQTILIHI